MPLEWWLMLGHCEKLARRSRIQMLCFPLPPLHLPLLLAARLVQWLGKQLNPAANLEI
jgi:hypothetical protein